MSPSSDNNAATAVIGVGNFLLRDEGAGIHAVDRLRTKDLPERVEIIDGATAGPGLRFFIEDRQRVIFIDSGDFGGEPGEYTLFKPGEAVSDKKLSNLTLHEFDLLAFLKQYMTDIGRDIDIRIYCIQPSMVEPGDTLSPEVEKTVDEIVNKICLDFQENYL